MMEQVVESMRQGMSPADAAEDAILRIIDRVPTYIGAVVALSHNGQHAGAAYGWEFTYSVRDSSSDVRLIKVAPLVRNQR